MKILPVIFFTTQKPQRSDYNKNQYDSYLNKELIQDTFTFTGRKPMSGKEFKKKCARFVRDFYTGEPMLESSDLTKMKKRGFFTGTIKEFLKKTKPYAEQFIEPKSVEEEVYLKIAEAAKTNPNTTLPELFQSWYKPARSSFRREQKPCFDHIKTLGAMLPQEHAERFFKFMEKIDRKLYDEPIVQEFSIKEFKYKISKTMEKSTDIALKNRISMYLGLLSDHSFVDDTPIHPSIIKKVFNFKNVKVPYRKSKYYDTHLKPYETDKDAVKIKIIELMRDALAAKGYLKLERICNDNIDMIMGKPVRVPFSNKTFVYDLAEALQDVPDEKLKKQILAAAENLPSSSQSPEAMILKLHDADPDVIGDRLFNPALASIEHFHPDSLGGSDDMVNCGLAKRWINTLRGNEALWAFIERMGFDSKHQYSYADDIVRCNHKQKVPYEDALGHLETIEKEARMDLTKYKDKLKPYEAPADVMKKKFAKK